MAIAVDERLKAAWHRLDPILAAAYRAGMETRDLTAELQRLLTRIDALATQMQRLQDENRSLRQQHEQIANERAQLLAKQELARTRVEGMISRLKSLEQHT